MKSANEFYYICPRGHVTVGLTDRKKKCDQKIREMKLVKKGKAGMEKEVVKETTCNEEIEETHPLPKELDFFNIWKPQVVKAFLQGQDPHALREGFLIDMQRVCTALRTKIDDLEKQIKGSKK
jgi:hypothetical protein